MKKKGGKVVTDKCIEDALREIGEIVKRGTYDLITLSSAGKECGMTATKMAALAKSKSPPFNTRVCVESGRAIGVIVDEKWRHFKKLKRGENEDF